LVWLRVDGLVNATKPLHWLIYGAGAFGFWKMRPWMWPWAADCSGANAASISISVSSQSCAASGAIAFEATLFSTKIRSSSNQFMTTILIFCAESWLASTFFLFLDDKAPNFLVYIPLSLAGI